MQLDKKALCIASFMLCVVLFGWLLFTEQCKDIHDDGAGVDKVRDDLSTVGDQQQSAIERLEAIESGTRDAQKSADRVDAAISAGQAITDDSANLIAEGQRILAGIRQRNTR